VHYLDLRRMASQPEYEYEMHEKSGGISTSSATSETRGLVDDEELSSPRSMSGEEQDEELYSTRSMPGEEQDEELYSPRSVQGELQRRLLRQNRMVLLGIVVFLAVVLAVAYHSSHSGGNEGQSIPGADTFGVHGNGRPPAIAIALPDTMNGSKVSTSTVTSPNTETTLPKEGPGVGRGVIHSQCARGTSELKNRPMIIFKSARTGSTWLAWTGQELELVSGKKMLWTTEVGGCGKLYNRQLAKWLIKYFTQGREGNEVEHHGRKLKLKCRMQGSGVDDFGPIIATIDVKKTPNDIPEDEWVPNLSLEQWREVFKAVPNLAIGVLVRTNAVKRAISSIAAEEQVRICGDKVGKKLTGKEKCIKDLPEQVHLNTTVLWDHVTKSDRKRQKLPELAARLSSKYSDGKVFCISYEGMEMNMPRVMDDLGKFIGAGVDPKSIAELREKQVSKKRGSDDLSEYISNYEEVRESLSSNKCILDMLESRQPKIFPACLHTS